MSTATALTHQQQQQNTAVRGRRNLPGTPYADLWKWPKRVLSDPEGDPEMALQEYIQDLARDRETTLDELNQLPEGQNELRWQYEHLRQFVLEFNHLLVQLADTCTPVSCPKMTASHEWQYLCAAHKKPQDCTAIDYMTHTIDGTSAVLTNLKLFPSRQVIPSASASKYFPSMARRLYRIFTHVYYHHRDVFDLFEKESRLCARFTDFMLRFQLMQQNNFLIPKESLGISQSPRGGGGTGGGGGGNQPAPPQAAAHHGQQAHAHGPSGGGIPAHHGNIPAHHQQAGAPPHGGQGVPKLSAAEPLPSSGGGHRGLAPGAGGAHHGGSGQAHGSTANPATPSPPPVPPQQHHAMGGGGHHPGGQVQQGSGGGGGRGAHDQWVPADMNYGTPEKGARGGPPPSVPAHATPHVSHQGSTPPTTVLPGKRGDERTWDKQTAGDAPTGSGPVPGASAQAVTRGSSEQIGDGEASEAATEIDTSGG
uniref:Uncharacterized protein n=1 Tax=Chromera velia CCMP2878 TaxID=1169474 RepID=A0A0G4EZS8_9ALVE|eukprot:Cvel_2557.t1-p1 / transcript=Cvel_2557.t1 / gene=Cvel_2557 / organism=Chromera_velia_CCMP2878 / gene_product=MOB-like protein phocein, putative / transcript_product=MOB-like protein phocein, putative / location=Cvel_scaffold101:39289-43527(+) / protein_length=478 / sequence_SO=supercontig / SO=protein_coding / is_pseudo=false